MQVMSRKGGGSPDDSPSFEYLNAEGDPACLLLCDHASNALPRGYGTLGLPETEFTRHIAYDIGAAEVVRLLSEYLDAPAVLARYSRLLIDLNRGPDDPTLVMKLSDGAIIAANRDVDPFGGAIEFEHRLRHFYLPYHEAIDTAIARARATGVVPLIVSLHSFTPAWRNHARPWHVGILWDRDDRLPSRLLRALRLEPGLVVGDNEPYSGRLKGDCLYRHGTLNGLAHALVEIRQDLIADEAGQLEWAALISAMLRDLASDPELHEIRHHGSHAD